MVIKREHNISLALTALSGSAFMHLILSNAHLDWPHKGHLAMHAANVSVTTTLVCASLTFDLFLGYNHPFISLLTDHNAGDSLCH